MAHQEVWAEQLDQEVGAAMANFDHHIESLIRKEGGYVLTDKPTDRGGRTYAGISEKANPDWEGWALLDSGAPRAALRLPVHRLYRDSYWNPIRGDVLTNDEVVEVLFSSAVLSGPRTAIRLAQGVVGAQRDGKMGPQTVAALNGHATTCQQFERDLGIERIARFSRIVARDRKTYRVIDQDGTVVDTVKSQELNFWGWVNRVLREQGHNV